jgi:hypothetical protein
MRAAAPTASLRVRIGGRLRPEVEASPRTVAYEVRRTIAARYREHWNNSARVLCAEFDINRKTLHAYAREFKGRL